MKKEHGFISIRFIGNSPNIGDLKGSDKKNMEPENDGMFQFRFHVSFR